MQVVIFSLLCMCLKKSSKQQVVDDAFWKDIDNYLDKLIYY